MILKAVVRLSSDYDQGSHEIDLTLNGHATPMHIVLNGGGFINEAEELTIGQKITTLINEANIEVCSVADDEATAQDEAALAVRAKFPGILGSADTW